MAAPLPAERGAPEPPLVESLLGVHSAPDAAWLAETVTSAAERGLGALYALVYLRDASGRLEGEPPAKTRPSRLLLRLQQAVGTDPTALRLDPKENARLASVLEEGRAVAFQRLNDVLPLALGPEAVLETQRRLGVASIVAAPLHWDGESLGVLVLLMPVHEPRLDQAELLGIHVGLALRNLREKEAGRRRGEIDAVRWVYDELRFHEELVQETRRAQRHGRPLSVLALRLVNLDDIRAHYGRFLTERLLRQVARQLEDAMRDTDFLGASGKDGFAAILVEADDAGAARANERLMQGLQTVRIPEANLPDLRPQFRCATATLGRDGDSADELLHAARAKL